MNSFARRALSALVALVAVTGLVVASSSAAEAKKDSSWPGKHANQSAKDSSWPG